MCFFPELAFSFFSFSPSPFHSATSPIHTATVNSTRPQFPNLKNGTDGDCRRAPQEWQYGMCRGCQRAPQEWSGQSALGWTGGMKHTWADRGSRNGSVQLTKPHLRLSVSKLGHPRWRPNTLTIKSPLLLFVIMSRIPQLYNFHLNIVLKQGGNFRLLVFSFFEEDRTCIVGHFICRAPLPNGKDILFFLRERYSIFVPYPLQKSSGS
jgi:hypothetical protein